MFAGAAAGFVLLGLCVRLGLLDGPDRRVFELGRPQDVWGPAQMRSVHVVDGLQPRVVALLLAAFTLVVCLARRSPRPAVLTGSAGLVAAAATVLTKIALARPDPHDSMSSHGGSFPSGHTVGVVVCVGLAVFLLRPGAPWWGVLVSVALGVVMGTALVVEGAHWASDVAGGLLLGVAVLAAVRASGFAKWAAVTGSQGARAG
ncbi:MAG TPA: phosphatase PAP2 family protein [Kineosporiaceae bacterium]|nr:phosphatase PAP2 family protein [Kineosporiaceae bacterium]